MAQIEWDAEVPGLGIRKNKNGDIWILKYRVKERQLLTTLGPVKLLSAVQARALAIKAKWEGKQGAGPEKKERIKKIDFEAFADEYMERHAKRFKRSWKKDQERINLYLKPRFKGRDLASITHEEIKKLHSEISDRPKSPATTAANRLIEVVSKMFNLAVEWKHLPKDWENPAAGIARNPEKKRTRWLTEEEITRMAPVLNALPDVQRVFYWLLLLTGLRYSELLTLTWSDIDLANGRLFIRDTKNGEPHTIPLPQIGVEMLQSLSKGEGWVFPGRKGTGKYFTRMDKTWRRIRGKVGLEDVCIHHFRHTMASRLVQKGYGLKVIAELLNHKTLSTTMRYAHCGSDHLRAALDDNAETIKCKRVSTM